MKLRTVMVTLEIDCGVNLNKLRSALWWVDRTHLLVHQAQANVIRTTTPKRKARKKA